ncbi:MAG TPA: MBL fold metallo-hydrolase [Prolixibacteraceae bacterium]|nr:MBL fold metallo-hydrolase [Prolixibacteraceae bacterium]
MKIWTTQSGYTIEQIISGRSNVFLVSNGNKRIIVDASVKRLRKKMFRRLNRLGVSSVDYLILTHTHFDHVGNAQSIKDAFSAKVVVHKNEAQFLQNGISILPKGTNWFTRHVVGFLGKVFAPLTNFKPCKPEMLIDSAYSFNDIGVNAYIIHTPGHSAGSISLIVDNEIAIVGDSLFGIFPNSVFPPFADNVPEMITSWHKLLETNCHTFLPAHGTFNSQQLLQNEYVRSTKKSNNLFL